MTGLPIKLVSYLIWRQLICTGMAEIIGVGMQTTVS